MNELNGKIIESVKKTYNGFSIKFTDGDILGVDAMIVSAPYDEEVVEIDLWLNHEIIKLESD